MVEKKRAGHKIEGALLVGQVFGVTYPEIGVPKLRLCEGYHSLRQIKAEKLRCRSLLVDRTQEPARPAPDIPSSLVSHRTLNWIHEGRLSHS